MAVTNYLSFGGEIFGEQIVGGAGRTYKADGLRSTTLTADSTGAVENTYRYKPFGGQLAKTGVQPDPSFRWIGIEGYRQTARPYSELYVRARHFSTGVCLWTSTDPLWPEEHPYSYCNGNPIGQSDPSGLAKNNFGECKCLSTAGRSTIQKKLSDPACANAVKKECKEDGNKALNDPSIVPTWYTSDGNCDPRSHAAACTPTSPLPPYPPPLGAPCKASGICIDQAFCGSGPPGVGNRIGDLQACLVLFELGNACQCKTKGWYTNENAANRIAKACGCPSMGGGVR